MVVNPETDFVAERFHDGAQVWTRVAGRDEALTIADARVEGRRPILAFDGYDSIEAAERLAGAELRVPESALQPLPEGHATTCTSWSGAGSRRSTARRSAT